MDYTVMLFPTNLRRKASPDAELCDTLRDDTNTRQLAGIASM